MVDENSSVHHVMIYLIFFFSYDLICPIFNRHDSRLNIVSIDRCDFHPFYPQLCFASPRKQRTYSATIFRRANPVQSQCCYDSLHSYAITGYILPSAMSDTRVRAQRLISVAAATMIALACGTNVG